VSEIPGSSVIEFAHDLVQDVVASAEADSISTHDAFAERVLGDLESAGLLEDWFVAYYRTYGIEVSGYGFNDGLGTLDLFIVQFRQQPLAVKVGMQEISALGKRVMNYLAKARKGLRDRLDDSLEAYDMCVAVEEAIAKEASIRVFIITNDVSTTRRLRAVEDDGRPVIFEVWDLNRLHRLATSGVLHEPIVVEFPEALPCLSTPKTDENYSVFLSIIRGDILASVYREYGPRLLELNVRSFLQLKGAVNRGIRETLINSPERFLAYNNGISATASKVDHVRLDDGRLAIKRVHDFQIVNGGQTTASLHSAFIKKEGDLERVFVQAKLTVVQPEHLNEIVPEISRFSNTQNKVTIVDFSSNDPYHVELEKITRTMWAPAKDASGQETKWFYERARGQYADALNRERTPAKQKAFKIQYPARQKFLKTDVAKWEQSWNQKPWLVSRGAEKNFRAFMIDYEGKIPTTDVGYVRRLIAKGILFRVTEKIVTEQQFGGYRANIVTYTIAKLCNSTAQRVDLESIWRDQTISDALIDALADVSRLMYKIVINPPAGTTHVGEWTKKETCWARAADLAWSIPVSLERELVDVSKARALQKDGAVVGLSKEDESVIAEAAKVPAESWFALAHWARETGNLAAWQRSLAHSMGRVKSRGDQPTLKQARQGIIILDTAKSVGFGS
jgi:AIPR protein